MRRLLQDFTLIPNEDESEHSWYSRMRQKFGSNWKYATDHINDLFRSKSTGVYMELQNLDEKPGIEKILEKYPDWDPLSNNIIYQEDENGDVFVRINKKGSKLYPLDDISDAPITLVKHMGWSADHIEIYNQTKKDLDIFYPNNRISREAGFDIRYNSKDIVEIFDNKKWYPISTKMGEEFSQKAIGRLTNNIKNNLGESAVIQLEKLVKKTTEKEDELRHIEPRVVILNDEIAGNQQQFAANRGSIESLEAFIDSKVDNPEDQDEHYQK